MRKIKVSVIIPIYNTEKYLEKCLNSVINQTLKEIEIICVNDGSTDSSLDILNNYANKDNRIIIVNQKNLRQASARNNGMKIAKGEYISFVDSDDWIENNFLENMHNAAKNNDADIVCSNVKEYIDEKIYHSFSYVAKWTFFNHNKKHLTTPEDRFGVIYSCAIWNKIYRKDFLIENEICFFENLFLEDVSFNHITAILSNKIILIKDAYYCYNISNPQSFMKLAGIKKETMDMINMTAFSKNYIKRKKIKYLQKYLQILDGFEIYNLEGWLNNINYKYKSAFYKKMRNIFKNIDIQNNRFILTKSKLFYNKAIKYKTLSEFNCNRNINIFNKAFSIYQNDKYNFINLLGFKISIKKDKKHLKFDDWNYIKGLIDENSVISFDIFDTLLLRPYANPKNVFRHLEELNNSIGFSAVREIAEYNLRKYKNIEYADYNEIYGILPSDFQFLKEKELQLEKDTLYANPQMKEIFDYAKSLNKTIILTSDMYFSSKILDDILKKNGFAGYQKIYISGELKKAKYDGSLYNYITEDLNAIPKSILHIGNNEYADYKTAVNSNLNAFHYIEPMEQFFIKYPKFRKFYSENRESLTAGIIIGILTKKYLENDKINLDYWKYFGYFLGGPVCYGISKFAYNEATNKNIKEFLFVARDGYTIEKIFNLFNKDNKIKTRYVYAPRSLNVLINLDYKNNFHFENKLNSLIYLIKELRPELKDQINKLHTDKDKADFIENNASLLNSISIEMKKAYKKYIERFNIKQNIALFDIAAGNFSSMKLLKNILNKNIYGIYWHILDEADRKNIDCIAYQKNFINYIKKYEVLELIITAPELPIKYIDKDMNFIRINNRYEIERMKCYSIVSDWEINFSEDLLSIFKDYDINFSYNELINLINIFFEIIDDNDKKHLQNIKHGMDEAHTIYEPLILINKKINKLFGFFEDGKYKIFYIFGIRISVKK